MVPEDRGSMFFLGIGIYLQRHMAVIKTQKTYFNKLVQDGSILIMLS
jgi:hypothetical protein